LQGDGGSYECDEYSDDVTADDVTESDCDVDDDDWMRREQRRHAQLSVCSRDNDSQTSLRLSDFDRSTFYDYDYNDDDKDDNNYNKDDKGDNDDKDDDKNGNDYNDDDKDDSDASDDDKNGNDYNDDDKDDSDTSDDDKNGNGDNVDDKDDEVNGASSNSDESRSLACQAPQINEVTVVYVKYPDECCPKCCTAGCQSCWDAFDRTRVGRVSGPRTRVGRAWFNWRNVNFILVEHKYFET